MPDGEHPIPEYRYLSAWYTYPHAEEAPHLGHSKHLCEMAKRGEDLETFKSLVRNPKFICKKCGRVAAKEENLCEPVTLGTAQEFKCPKCGMAFKSKEALKEHAKKHM